METRKHSERPWKRSAAKMTKEDETFRDGTDLEPLTAETFERRLNSLSQALNALEDFHRAFVSQHPEYGKRFSRLS